MATAHCLAGCAIGEVLGMIIGGVLGWSNAATIALSIGLAFISGYSLTMLPLRRSGMSLRDAVRVALAADTASIAIMEVIDNAIMLVIPGAMSSGVDSWLFWASLLLSLALAGFAAFPVNRWLIARGKGHSAAHAAHSGGHSAPHHESHTAEEH